jgi:hypothetical protein
MFLEGGSIGRGNTEDLAFFAARSLPCLGIQLHALALGAPVEKLLDTGDRSLDHGAELAKKAWRVGVRSAGTAPVGVPRVSEHTPLKCKLTQVVHVREEEIA